MRAWVCVCIFVRQYWVGSWNPNSTLSPVIHLPSAQIEANKLQGAAGEQIEPQISVLLDQLNKFPHSVASVPLEASGGKMGNGFIEMTKCNHWLSKGEEKKNPHSDIHAIRHQFKTVGTFQASACNKSCWRGRRISPAMNMHTVAALCSDLMGPLVWRNCLCIMDFYLLGCWNLVKPGNSEKKRLDFLLESVFWAGSFLYGSGEFCRKSQAVCFWAWQPRAR